MIQIKVAKLPSPSYKMPVQAGKLCSAKWHLSMPLTASTRLTQAGPTVEPAWPCLISALLKTTVTNGAFRKNINTVDCVTAKTVI